jgi:hypothetical protein
LKIVLENPLVIPHEIFKHAGFCEMLVCPVCCSLFGRWQSHLWFRSRECFGLLMGWSAIILVWHTDNR